MKKISFLINKDSKKILPGCLKAIENLRSKNAEAEIFICEASIIDKELARHIENKSADILDKTLFVTDIAECAKLLTEKNFCVAALEHEENTSEKFDGIKYIFSEPEEVDFDSYLKAYQRIKGLPWNILQTKRCLIRETTVDDVDKLYKIYSEPEMTRYMEGLFSDPEDEKRYMKDYIDKVYGFMGFGVWSVIEKESNELIGRAGFSIRKGFDHPEIGFLISKSRQNMGYAKEVASAVLDYGKSVLGFCLVQALVKRGNIISINLLKKLGFKIERMVEVEEDIYGGKYLNEKGNFNTVNKENRPSFGTYIELIKEM